MDFSVHQNREDLRWSYRLDGEVSERTYPTAGDAERAALIAIKKTRKEGGGRQWMIIAIVGGVAVVAFLIYLVQVYLLGG